MLRSIILIPLLLLLSVACATPPVVTLTADVPTTLAEDAVTSVAEATPDNADEILTDDSTDSSNDDSNEPTPSPIPTTTPFVATIEPTAIIPTPVSPRPVDDGTIVETPPAEPVTVTIQRGDTLGEIANAYGLSSYDLAVYNSIFDTNAIEVGQVIEIPAEAIAAIAAAERGEATENEVVETVPTATNEPTLAPTGTATDEPTVVPTDEPTLAPTEIVETSAEINEPLTYTVQPGDSLTRLSVEFDVPLRELALANELRVDSDLVIGQVLIIPGEETSPVVDEQPASESTTYVVQPGDTLREIAIEFNVSEQAILDANNVENADRILVGQTLIIPNE